MFQAVHHSNVKRRREVQALLFDRDEYSIFKSWRLLRRSGFKALPFNIAKTKKYYRYRINDPIIYKNFSTSDLGNGIKVVYGYT